MALVLTHNLKAFLNTTFILLYLLLSFFFTTHITPPSPSFKYPIALDLTITTTALNHHLSKCLYLHAVYCICSSLGYSLCLLVLLSLFGAKSLSRELKLYVLLVSVAHFHQNSLQGNEEDEPSSYYVKFKARASHYIRWFINLIEMPPYLLGLTLLAWGNSLGDLIANVAMAVSNGTGGAQVVVFGFCGRPIFNMLAGLGLSLVVSAWSAHPRPFLIPVGPAVFEILGFLVGGLVWTLVILPKRDMKLDSVVGVGLLVIYSCFLSLRLSQSLGLVQFSKQCSLF